jgi:CRP-like cAMP-binding protein
MTSNMATFDIADTWAEATGSAASSSNWKRMPKALARSMERALTRRLAAGFASDPLRLSADGDPGTNGTPSRRWEHPASVSFWGTLTESERRAFATLASRRTFPRCALLMREGEPPDFVFVILDGRTRVYASRDGERRLLAERGPGQLIGEQAALELNVRSATVVAIEPTNVLVMATEDFWGFLQAYPAVHAIIEGQNYDRRSDGQRPSRTLLNGQNCTIVRTDVVGFGQQTRNSDQRRLIRNANLIMTTKAMGSIWDSYSMEDRGDGLLMVVRPDIATQRVVECLLNEFPSALRKHNNTYAEGNRIQLRVAIDVGPVVSDALGISGDAIIRTSRMLEADTFKTAIKESGANLGLIASPFVYDSIIKHADGLGDPRQYTSIQVDVKESSFPAWMLLMH